MCRSEPQIALDVIFTIASVGASSRGSSTCSTATSRGPLYTTAFTATPSVCRFAPYRPATPAGMRETWADPGAAGAAGRRPAYYSLPGRRPGARGWRWPMRVDAMVRGLDELTAQDLRERGSLKWTAHGGDMIGAFVAEMDFGPPPAVTRALHTAVTRGHVGYLPPWLATEVAEACAQWQLHRYGWRVAPEMIKPVADVLTAFELVVRHYTRPNSPIVLPTPAYMPFLTVPSLLGRRVIQVPMIRDAGRYVLDLDAIDRAFAAGGHLLVLCNPANPV